MATETPAEKQPDASKTDPEKGMTKPAPAKEIGGPKGLEPTRYGDWERKGIVSDF
jgi:hypothetical protein